MISLSPGGTQVKIVKAEQPLGRTVVEKIGFSEVCVCGVEDTVLVPAS